MKFIQKDVVILEKSPTLVGSQPLKLTARITVIKGEGLTLSRSMEKQVAKTLSIFISIEKLPRSSFSIFQLDIFITYITKCTQSIALYLTPVSAMCSPFCLPVIITSKTK